MTRFKLLLTNLQNGICEPWQKIPTILAVFVAEASVVLLDPSHEHFPAVNKFLLQSPRISLTVCPAELNFFNHISLHDLVSWIKISLLF